MNAQVFVALVQDGIASGAIYVLVALALVLVFSVTRVIFVPQGEFIAYGALTLAALETDTMPGVPWLALAIGTAGLAREAATVARGDGSWGTLGSAAAIGVLLPLSALALAWASRPWWSLASVRWVVAIACVLPLAPILYRVVFRPIAGASTLTLLIAAISAHLALVGAGLVLFGAEGVRTAKVVEGTLVLGPIVVMWQTLAMVAACALSVGGLYLLFERTLIGKALRASAVSRRGARIVGIRVGLSGTVAFTIAGALGVVCGLLIGATTTVYYESGFLLGLKGFVGAIVGGLVGYPAAAAGALLVGFLEAFSSFYASRHKEIIVFALLIPVLLWRSIDHSHDEDEEAEG